MRTTSALQLHRAHPHHAGFVATRPPIARILLPQGFPSRGFLAARPRIVWERLQHGPPKNKLWTGKFCPASFWKSLSHIHPAMTAISALTSTPHLCYKKRFCICLRQCLPLASDQSASVPACMPFHMCAALSSSSSVCLCVCLCLIVCPSMCCTYLSVWLCASDYPIVCLSGR